jgi:hypothetical protein
VNVACALEREAYRRASSGADIICVQAFSYQQLSIEKCAANFNKKFGLFASPAGDRQRHCRLYEGGLAGDLIVPVSRWANGMKPAFLDQDVKLQQGGLPFQGTPTASEPNPASPPST